MKHADFIKLNFLQQCTHLRDDAVQVAYKKGYKYDFYLFQLGSFYIEVQRYLRDDKIKDMVSFASTEPLEKYLKEIDIITVLR